MHLPGGPPGLEVVLDGPRSHAAASRLNPPPDDRAQNGKEAWRLR